MDFLRNRIFRQTLLCHADVKLDYTLQPEAVKSFSIASSAKPLTDEPDLTRMRRWNSARAMPRAKHLRRNAR